MVASIVHAAVIASPDKLKTEQGYRQDAKTGLNEISKKAQELADLIRSHRSHCEKAQVGGVYFDVIDCLDRWFDIVIHDNSRPRWLPVPNLYRDYVRAEMEPLRLRFDGKYWPSADDLLDGLAVLANESELVAGSSVTAASRLTRKVSPRSFIYTLLEVLHRNSFGNGPLPPGFELKPKIIATITNCALGLIDDQVSENNAKKAIVEFKKRNLTIDF